MTFPKQQRKKTNVNNHYKVSGGKIKTDMTIQSVSVEQRTDSQEKFATVLIVFTEKTQNKGQ